MCLTTPPRELYQAYNPIFKQYGKPKPGQTLEIRQSNRQARASRRSPCSTGLKPMWLRWRWRRHRRHQRRRPNAAFRPTGSKHCPTTTAPPYTSTIVFLVRKGNPEKYSATGAIW